MKTRLLRRLRKEASKQYLVREFSKTRFQIIERTILYIGFEEPYRIKKRTILGDFNNSGKAIFHCNRFRNNLIRERISSIRANRFKIIY